jgi:8-oxo-dGTP diphosphatase
MDKSNSEVFTSKYWHPAVTADSVVFGFDGKELYILLVERGQEPYKGCWALPGGFLREADCSLEDCAKRELLEETNVKVHEMRQLGAFGNIDRDPRERVITTAFYALIRPSYYKVIGGDDAHGAKWWPIDAIPNLAFDHSDIIFQARKRIKEDARHQDIAFSLLNDTFSIGELQRLYEKIMGVKYDRRNFERKMRSSGILQEAGIRREKIQSRPAQLFSLDKDKFEEVKEKDNGEFDF